VYSLRFLGGQYFFGGGQSKLSGNISGLAAPGVRYSDRWSFFPSLSSAFKGTKEVVDVVGAGTVFQEQMDHRAAFKAVYTPDRVGEKWRIKPWAGFKARLLNETRDEGFGSGLFDYRTLDLGLEAEYLYRKPFGVRASLTYFRVHFPNYTSLESQAAADFQGQSLSRELVGDHVLDSSGQLLRVSGEAPWRGLVLEGACSIMHQSYGEQHLVDASGELSGPLRRDFTQSLSGSASFPHRFTGRVKMNASFSLDFTWKESNQNGYDALRLRFNEDYYGYRELQVRPGLRFLVGEADWPTTFGLDTVLTLRSYTGREIQNAAGLYQGDTLRQNSFFFSATLSRPIAQRMKALFNVQHGLAWSNQEYEAYYRYGYSATNYLFGVSYDY